MTNRHRRGQGLVEGTFVMLVFFALLFGVIDCGQVMFTHQALVERVRGAVRWGSLHPWEGPEPVINLILFDHPESPHQTGPGFLGMTPENVRVTYRPPTPENPDDESISVAIVNFESHFFSPWIARAIISARPVLISAPMEVHTAPAPSVPATASPKP